MSVKPENLVNKQTCLELLNWLEKNGADEIKAARFKLFRPFATEGNEAPGCSLLYSQFIHYYSKHKLVMGKWTPSSLRKELGYLSTRILQPASKRIGLKKYITIGANQENGCFELQYRNRPELDNMLKKFDDTGMSDEQWLNLVAEGVENGYKLIFSSHSKTTTVTVMEDNNKSSLEKIERLHKVPREKEIIVDRKNEYSYIQHNPAIKEEKWVVTCLDCIIGKTNEKGEPTPEHLIGIYKNYCRKLAKHHGGYCRFDVDRKISFYFGLDPVNGHHAYTSVRTATLILQKRHRIDSDRDKTPTLQLFVHTRDAMISFPEGQPSVRFADFENNIENMNKYSTADTITINPRTYKLAGDKFKTIPLGNSTKNNSPVGYRVLHELDSPTAFSPILGSNTPLIGRKNEATQLYNIYKQAQNGHPQIAFVHGTPPGIGKSLLIDKLTSQASNEDFPAFVLTCQCWKCYKHSPYYPISRMLMHHLKLKSGETKKNCINRLKRLFQQLELKDQNSLHALEMLIDPDEMIISQDTYDTLSSYDATCRYAMADEFKNQFAIAVEQILLGLTKHQLVILLIEDVQWADQSTLHIIENILHKITEMESLRLLIIVTYRSYNPLNIPPSLKKLSNDIQLPPLIESTTRELALEVAKSLKKKFSAAELDGIVRHSDGIPLVVWEKVAQDVLPPRWFNEVLFETEDLDDEKKLITRKMLAQIASILGDRMHCEDLRDIVFFLNGIERDTETDMAFEKALAKLCETDLVLHQPDTFPQSLCFTFPSVQKRLYESISAQDKMQNHLRIATFFQISCKDNIKGTSETIARHYLLACRHANEIEQKEDLLIKAAHWWKLTGKTALFHLGIPEAVKCLERSLRLTKRLQENVANHKFRLQIFLDMDTAYQHQHGVSSEKVMQLYEQAKKVAEQVDEPSLIFRMHWISWFSAYLKGDLNKAEKLANDLLRLDACEELSKCQLEAQHAMWDTLFHTGHLTTATAFHIQGLNTFRKMSLEERSDGYAGHAASSCCLSRCAMVFWLRGFVDQAMLISTDSISEAKQIEHPNSQVHTYCHAAILGLLSKNSDYALNNANKALSYADQYNLKPRRILCEILSNAGKLLLNPDKDLISDLEKNLDKWKKMGFRLFGTLWLTCMAEAQLKIHNPAKCLDSAEQAYSIAYDLGEFFYLPEIHRVKAEALMAKSKRNKKVSKQLLYKAINIAKESSSQTLELRSLVSLNRLLYNHGASVQEKKQAHQNLQNCFEWFHEGQNTTELSTARNFLKEIDSLV